MLIISHFEVSDVCKILYYLSCHFGYCKENSQVFNILNKIEVDSVSCKVCVGVSLLQKGSKGSSICPPQHHVVNMATLTTVSILYHASVQPVAKGKEQEERRKVYFFWGSNQNCTWCWLLTRMWQ